MSKPLADMVILLIEDEFLVAAMIADALEDAGARVIGPAATLDVAMRLAAEENFHVAVLDWNLDGESSVDVARTLARRELPCVVSTGYGGTDEEFAHFPVIAKPYDPLDLIHLLQMATGRRPAD